MVDTNFVLLFEKSSSDDNLYNFSGVVKVQNNKVISDSPYFGITLNKNALIKADFNKISNNFLSKAIGVDFTIYDKSLFQKSAYFDSNDYIGLKLSKEHFANLAKKMFELNPDLDVSEIQSRICKLLYQIGDGLKDIREDEHSFYSSVKVELDKIEIRDDETIRKSIGPYNTYKSGDAMEKNEEANITITATPKKNSDVGNVNISELDPDDIIKKLKEKIIGQDNAIVDVVDTIFMNQMFIANGDEDDITVGKSNILIDGPTGTGKTMIVKELSKNLGLPMVIVGVTSFSTAGYKGADLEDILIKLLDAAGGNVELAQTGIICLDEFDKLGSRDDRDSLAMKRALQQELLAYLSGGIFDISYKGKKVEFDTSKVTFIALGAFTNLRERKIQDNERRFNSSKIGFGNEKKQVYDRTYEINTQDYIDEGINREFIGRFTTQTYTRALTVEDYKKILTDSLASPLRTLRKLVESYGKKLIYTDDVIDYIANLVNSNGTGARGLQTIFNPISRALMREIRGKEGKEIYLTIELIEKLQNQNIRRY